MIKITQKFFQFFFTWTSIEVEDAITHKKELAVSYCLFRIFSKTIYKSI